MKSPESIASNLEAVRDRIRAAEQKYGRPPESVQLLAVSKTKPVPAILEACAAGQLDFGENYLQDAVAKIAAVEQSALRWHFIGPVQSNKSREIATHFQWLHSLDRLKIARRPTCRISGYGA